MSTDSEPPAPLPVADLSPTPWRSPLPWRAFRHASDGVLYATLTQRNMLVHLLAFAVIITLALLMRVGPTGLVTLCFAGTLVVLAEMLNTAIEAIVDMVMPTYHPLARVAKDVGAGATLVASLNAVAVGTVVFGWMESRGSVTSVLPLSPDTLWIVPALVLLPLLGLLVYRALTFLRRFKTPAKKDRFEGGTSAETLVAHLGTSETVPIAARPAAPQR